MLEEYLKVNGLSHSEFAALCGLKQYEISRILSSGQKPSGRKPSVRIAKIIQRVTNGEVTCSDLRPDIFSEVSA